MIHVIVEHFLTTQGREYFAKWISYGEEVLKDYDGFIEISEAEDPENDNRSILLLKFKNYRLLSVWASSRDHERLLDKLRPFMKQKQKSQIFRIMN